MPTVPFSKIVIFLFFLLLHSIHALEVTIKSVTYSGSGCPVGTVSTSRNLDSTVVTQGFDAFALYIGPGTRLSDRVKDCIVDISFDVLGGDKDCGKIVVNRRGLDLTGYAYIDESVTLSIRVGYDWQGVNGVANNTLQVKTLRDYPSGWVGRYHIESSPTNVVTSPCGGGKLRIIYRMGLTSTSPSPGGTIRPDPDMDGHWTFQHSLVLE